MRGPVLLKSFRAFLLWPLALGLAHPAWALKPVAARHGMVDLLRGAFARDSRVTVDYIKTGLRNGRIIRVADLP